MRETFGNKKRIVSLIMSVQKKTRGLKEVNILEREKKEMVRESDQLKQNRV